MESIMTNRRAFLKRTLASGAALGGASLFNLAIPVTSAFANETKLNANPNAKPVKTLVLVELHGGNDSLNMTIPHNQQAYYDVRPTLAIKKPDQLTLTDELALNSVMQPLEASWANSELALLPGVGYPEPNRSHFRSIEIWDTASRSDEFLDEGWLSEVLQGHAKPETMAANAIVIGRNAAPLMGHDMKTLVMRNQASFIRDAKRLDKIIAETDNPTLKHILNVHRDARQGGEILKQGFEKAQKQAYSDKGKTPSNDKFLKDMREAAAIIQSGYGAPILKVALSGFDTHFNQKGQHQKLLTSLANGLAAFRASLQQSGHWDDVLVMTYSEFGRRVGENGSQGTDHGTAATHLMMGGKVKGGVLTDVPSLTNLKDKDLQFTTDFRSVYASVVEQWIGLKPQGHLAGFDQIGLLA
jgi:uncharacterized protein (DUF1501 family)